MRKRSSSLPSADDPYYDVITTPLGSFYLVFSGNALIRVERARPSCRRGESPPETRREFTGYFDGDVRRFTFPMRFVSGTPFEQSVWSSLLRIPYGETRSYKWLAEVVGRPKAVRAVGGALHRNPLPIIYPCHRVIGADGALAGYSFGTDMKRRLLDMEYYFSLDRQA